MNAGPRPRLQEILHDIAVAEDILADAEERGDEPLIWGMTQDLVVLHKQRDEVRQDCEICGDQATHERYDEHNGWQPFCASPECGPIPIQEDEYNPDSLAGVEYNDGFTPHE